MTIESFRIEVRDQLGIECLDIGTKQIRVPIQHENLIASGHTDAGQFSSFVIELAEKHGLTNSGSEPEILQFKET